MTGIGSFPEDDPRPGAFNREGVTWETCPDCGCGRGQDHQRHCPRRLRPKIPDYSGITVKPGKITPEILRWAEDAFDNESKK